MNTKLIEYIQSYPGEILVEPEFIDPPEDNQITVTITFLNLEE